MEHFSFSLSKASPIDLHVRYRYAPGGQAATHQWSASQANRCCFADQTRIAYKCTTGVDPYRRHSRQISSAPLPVCCPALSWQMLPRLSATANCTLRYVRCSPIAWATNTTSIATGTAHGALPPRGRPVQSRCPRSRPGCEERRRTSDTRPSQAAEGTRALRLMAGQIGSTRAAWMITGAGTAPRGTGASWHRRWNVHGSRSRSCREACPSNAPATCGLGKRSHFRGSSE